MRTESQPEEDAPLRIRVSNTGDSQEDQLQLQWVGQVDSESGNVQFVHCPAGQSRVVRVQRDSSSRQLSLTGDDNPFDNLLYVARQVPEERNLLYIGPDAERKESLIYFLKRANLNSARSHVTLVTKEASQQVGELLTEKTSLVVLGEPVGEETIDGLRKLCSARAGAF